MQRDKAIASLNRYKNEIKSFGATSLFLFGSTARNEATSESDLDIFIDYDLTQGISLIELAGIKVMLEENLAVGVDITTRNSLHPMLKSEIEKSAVCVF
jgi:predicted nucleotidyltransferase